MNNNGAGVALRHQLPPGRIYCFTLRMFLNRQPGKKFDYFETELARTVIKEYSRPVQYGLVATPEMTKENHDR